jgi:2-oxo-4-hydroxy-4-carboxy--5-ureidoimidazoline (OHCU) decarboxylase
MHELPRQLSSEELSELFEGRTRFVEMLSGLEDPLGQARRVLEGLPETEKIEALNAHPPIGARNGSARSMREQGSDEDPVLVSALARLNKTYEQKFGFRFVIFVNQRPRSEILHVLRERLQNRRDDELATGLDELVAIALDRWLTR